MAAAPVAATAENTNADTVPPVVVQSPPITHSQPIEIRYGQPPRIETEDGAEQELEEEDCLASTSVTESTTTTDVVPSHVRERILDKVDDDEGLDYADDAYASEDADAASSNGVGDYGNTVYLQDEASLCEKHTTITPPIAKVQLSVTTAMPMTPTRSEGLPDRTWPGNGLLRSWRLMVSNTRAHASGMKRAW